jgi:hypothetical protein
MEIIKPLEEEPPMYLRVIEQFSIEPDVSMDTGN